MTSPKMAAMIDFRPFSACDKALYEGFLFDGRERGCEFSFANVYCWGKQQFAPMHGQLLFFSQFDRRCVYPYPLGEGDKRAAIDALIADAASRGISFRLTGIRPEDREELERLYPEKFLFHCDEGSFDYVYAIDDLADLPGKKYHPKRTHLNRFLEACPDYRVEVLCEENLADARQMVDEWYEERMKQSEGDDYYMERTAIHRALRHVSELGMEGLLLRHNGRVVAMTMGSRLSRDTIDVHFEKARADVPGAYAAINCEFARHIRAKYPEIRFLDREEDMGLEGLRRAKRSYHPHHMVQKCWATLGEEEYED